MMEVNEHLANTVQALRVIASTLIVVGSAYLFRWWYER